MRLNETEEWIGCPHTPRIRVWAIENPRPNALLPNRTITLHRPIIYEKTGLYRANANIAQYCMAMLDISTTSQDLPAFSLSTPKTATPEKAHPEEGTATLDESYLQTVIYHNREYQQYAISNRTYFSPTDENEIERLHILHNVLDRTFDGRLIFPPISRPRRILDCGYGTASWASEVADQHPQCEVIGIDINPMLQTDAVPDNLYLQVDDLNSRFTFPSRNFDLVHSQMMATGIHVNRWSQYLRDIFRVTRAGGWCQMVELYFNIQSDNGSLTADHALQRWSSRYLQSMEGLKDLRVPLRLQNMMRDAGFVDVEGRMIQLHTCGWSSDQREYEIGVANRDNVQCLLSSAAVYPLTEISRLPIQDVQVLIAQARLEADNPALKAYFPLYVCIGRRPRSHR